MADKDKKKKIWHSRIAQAAAAVQQSPTTATGTQRSSAVKWHQTALGLGGALAAFLLGRCSLLFGARPLGIALLCAATHSIPYLYGGLVLSALTMGPGAAVLICTYTAALLIRILSRSAVETEETERADEQPHKRTPTVLLQWQEGRWFSENVYLRMMTACVSAFIVSLYTIIKGGFLYYDLFGAFFAMVTAPAATMLYAGLFGRGAGAQGPLPKEHTSRTLRLILAKGALALSLLFSLRDLYLFNISLSALGGFALTLWTARRRGLIPGLICGLLCGLAHDPVLTPSFVLGALAFSLLLRFAPTIAAMGAALAGLSWSFYPLGFATLSSFFPAILSASLGVYAFDKLADRPAPLFGALPQASSIERAEQADVDRMQVERYEARLTQLSDTFSGMARLFYNLSDRLKRPGLLDLRRMCDRRFDAVCNECPGRELCWGTDYVGTMTQLSRMAAALYERGQVGQEDVSDTFAARCQSLPRLWQEMNEECARMTQAALQNEKTEVFAMDYEGLSHILADALEEQRGEFAYDEEMSEQVRRALLAMDIGVDGVLVWGSRRRQIVARGIDASASTRGSGEIRQKLEEICGVALGDIHFDLAQTGVTMRVSTRPKLTARHALAALGAKGGICGDTVNTFGTEGEYRYALICDGMGTGQEAAFTSGMCSLFLEKMLTAGNRPDTALRMLGSMIRQKGVGLGMECSATIDLLELDLLTGKAVLLKCGACPTYVRRDDCLFRLHAHTAPIGILRQLDAQRLSCDILPGDVIILLSDGVGEATSPADSTEEDAPWLLDLLADGWLEDLDAMARLILSRAREEGSRDDMSVILVAVADADDVIGGCCT